MDKDKIITTRSVKYRRWYCTTCDTFTNSYNQFNQHLEGVGHRYNIMIKNKRKNNEYLYQDEEEYNIHFYVVAFIQVVIITFILFYLVVKISNN